MIRERGGPGKLRSYWELEIYAVTQKRKDMPVYEVQPESGNGRTRVLHRNLLLPCSFLPVETHLKSPRRHLTVSKRTHRRQTPKEETSGTIDEDIPGSTPDQLQEYYESTRNDTEDSCGTVPELVEQDTYPCPVDGPDSEGEVEDPEPPSGTIGNEAAHGAPIQQSQSQSQRVSKPPLMMTYDVMGQPSFQPSSTAGGRGITVSYPQQLWHPGHNSLSCSPSAILCPFQYGFNPCILCLCY